MNQSVLTSHLLAEVGNPCADKQCGSHGFCLLSNGTATCHCEDGYFRHAAAGQCLGEYFFIVTTTCYAIVFPGICCKIISCNNEWWFGIQHFGYRFCIIYNVEKDECYRGEDSCPDNSQCVNEIGSYTCTCNTGYRYDRESNSCKGMFLMSQAFVSWLNQDL